MIRAAFRFFTGTRVGVGILVGCIGFMVADIRRSRMDTANFAQRTAAFEQAQTDRDARIEKDTRNLVWHEIADATAANQTTDQQVKEFGDALPPSPPAGNPYLVGADASRLCRIAGKTRCGSGSDQGVPAAGRKSGRPADQRKIRLPDIIRTGAWPDRTGEPRR
jgi:hypothetical protein